MRENMSSYKIFNPQISGFEYIIPKENSETTGFKYKDSEGLRIIIHGPAGSGKTILALQLTIAGLGISNSDNEKSKNIIYFSKDSSSENLLYRIIMDFNFFQEGDIDFYFDQEKDKKEEKDKKDYFAENYKSFISFIIKVGGENIGIICMDKLIKFIIDNNLYYDEIFEFFLYNENFRVFKDNSKDKEDEEKVKKNEKEIKEEIVKSYKDEVFAILAFGNISSITGLDIRFNKYTVNKNIFMGLSSFYPKYQPIMSFLENEYNKDTVTGEEEKKYKNRKEKLKKWQKNLMIVIDSLPPDVIDECFKLYTEAIGFYKTNPDILPPVTLLIMENEEISDTMAYSYPPDVQIKLQMTSSIGNLRRKTIQVIKSRYQKIFDEAHPFLIIDYNKNYNKSKNSPLYIKSFEFTKTERAFKPYPFSEKLNEAHKPIETRKIGINILPTLASISIIAKEKDISPRTPMKIKFGIESFDEKMIEEGNLSGGGSTLLITENRCHSTAFGLHFLLGQIAQKVLKNPPFDAAEEIKSVLYISFSVSLKDILNDTFNFKAVRSAVYDKFAPERKITEDDLNIIKNFTLPIRPEEIQDEKQGLLRLYKIPLKRIISKECEDKKKGGCGFLYVFIPDLTWEEPEAILDIISRLLQYSAHNDNKVDNKNECKQCLQVDRVLLDRVSRIKIKMPLVKDVNAFVTSIVELCKSRNIEIMVIDDTIKQESIAGTVTSEWLSSAQNIISLKRISFQGTETVMIDIIKAAARTVRRERPQEFQKIQHYIDGINNYELRINDTFRGFTGLRSGDPKRIEVKIDLHYDKDNSPLHNELKIMRTNFESLMGIKEVKIMSPHERKITYSALINLAPVGQNICHVVDVDEIWLPQLLQNDCLSLFNNEHIISIYENMKSLKDLKQYYVTQGLSLAIDLTGKEEFLYAVPYRHNWGVLTAFTLKEIYTKEMRDNLDGYRFDDCPVQMRSKYREKIGNIISLAEKGFKFIYDFYDSKNIFTWHDLVNFKLNNWDGIEEHFYNLFKQIQDHEKLHKDYKYNFNFFHFFNYTTDSIVTFFLELVFAHIKYSELFKENEKNKGLFFNLDKPGKNVNIKNAFVSSLIVMYNLLDQKQRDDMFSEYNLQAKGNNYDEKKYAFITRDWCSTLPVIEEHDIRKSLELQYLPVANKNCKEIMKEYLKSQPYSKTQQGKVDQIISPNYDYTSIPISGSWYLGALSGGNREVAIDVIREIISETHERDRFAHKISPPVKRKFYTDTYIKKTDKLNFIPYTYIICELLKEEKQNYLDAKIIFPFSRSYVYKYLALSQEIYLTIKTIMSFSDKDMKYNEDGNYDAKEYKNISEETDSLLERIYNIQEEYENA